MNSPSTSPLGAEMRVIYEDVSFAMPEGWEQGDIDGEGVLLTDPDFYYYIFMEYLFDEEKDRPLATEIDDLIVNFSREKDGFNKINSGIAHNRNKVEYGYFSYQFMDKGGEQMRELEFVIPIPGKPDKRLFISMGAPESSYHDVESIFKQFIDGLELGRIEPVTPPPIVREY